MRNISFQLTTHQIRARTKNVTRRNGWWDLQPGDLIQACVKCMGLKKGEKIQKLAIIRVLSTRAEPLNAITQEDVNREGFPEMSPKQFVAMFRQHHRCSSRKKINRIEFEYVSYGAI